MPEPSTVSLVVCTRNRPADLAVLLRSIEAQIPSDVEVVIVDQSTDDRAPVDLPGVRHVRTETVGLSVARNIGLRAASSPIVLMTDDDCEVVPGWLEAMSAPFVDPSVAIVYGTVSAGEADWSTGFIPVSVIDARRRIDRPRSYDPRVGIGANMAVRRSVAIEAGGFDELLGAGAHFLAGEEIDLAIRLLLRGHAVVHQPDAEVVHHGFRTFEQGRTLVRGYAYGSGAVYTKLLKRGHPSAIPSLARAVHGLIVEPALGALRQGAAPPIAGRVRHLVRGMWGGLRTPVEPGTDMFRSPTGDGR